MSLMTVEKRELKKTWQFSMSYTTFGTELLVVRASCSYFCTLSILFQRKLLKPKYIKDILWLYILCFIWIT